ncbi:MAG TPA: MFS transporter [Anaerolineaceae bacterium]|nr:MFS transporter [Anaerolineaceae bacterium]
MNRLTSVMNLFPKKLQLFMTGMILANIAAMMYDPLLPLYLQHLGADVRQVGLFFTIAAVLPLLFQIFGGWISDSIGRLKAVAIGSVANMFTFIIFLLAPSWEWGLLAMATGAIGRSFVAPSFRAFIAEQSTENNRGKIYGIADTTFAVVGVLGPPLGGFLSDRYGYTMMFIVAAGFFTLATILRIGMAIRYNNLPTVNTASSEEIPAEPKQKTSLKNLKTSIGAMIGLLVGGGVATWILITDGIIDINFNMVGQLFPIYMNNEVGITNTQIGILNSISSIVTMSLLTISGYMSDRKGERLSIVLGMGTFAISMVVFISSRDFGSMSIAYILFGMGQALMSPAYSSLISKVIPEKLLGLAFGLFSTSVGVVALPAPFIGAWLYETYTPQLPFILPTIALLVSMPIAWKKFQIKKVEVDVPAGIPVTAD